MKHKNKSNIIVAIILCLPIILISILFIKYYNHNNATSSINDIYISIPDGNTMSLSGDNLKFYTDIYFNAQKTDYFPREIAENEPTLTIMYVINDITTHYDVYFSTDLKTSFLVSENNDCYLIDNETTKELSLRQEFNYIYTSNKIPTLSVTNKYLKEEIIPLEYNWKYLKADGNYYDYIIPNNQLNTERIIIHASETNKLSFSTNPDELSIVYYDEYGSIIKTSNSLEELKLDVTGDTYFSVSLEAKWSSLEDAKGHAKYHINFLYDLPEKFWLSTQNVDPGDYLIIYAEQFDLGEDILVESNLKNYCVKFIKHNKKTFAFVPIDSQNIANEYYIKLTVNNNVTELKFNVNYKDFGVSFYNPDKLLSDTANEDLLDLLSEIDKSNEPLNHFKFDSPFNMPIKADIYFNYGKEIFSSSGPASYFVQGNEYTVKLGSKIKSAECGIVTYVGENERLGKFVVIDHGLGIKSYYAHLDNISVDVGTLVQKNITIATSGNSGYTIDDMFYFAVSINGIFVDPDIILENGIKMP